MTLSLGVHCIEQPSSPRVPSPLFSTFESAERLRRAPRTTESKPRVGPGKGSHTPLGTSNEQFHYCLTPVINLHEHPPPLRSPPTSSPPPRHPPPPPPSVFLLSTFFPLHPHAPLPKLSFLPSSLHAFLFPPNPLDLVAPFSSPLDWKEFRLGKRGRGGTRGHGTSISAARIPFKEK